jgi:hypothetical protein
MSRQLHCPRLPGKGHPAPGLTPGRAHWNAATSPVPLDYRPGNGSFRIGRFDKDGMNGNPCREHMIDFNNLILGRHESKIVFMWRAESGAAVLGSYQGIKDGIEAILARNGTTCAQRAILEELRPLARNSDWDFTALKRTLLRSAALAEAG